MEFIDAQLDAYVCAHSEKESDVLKELNRRTHVSVLSPRMLSGHFQGRVLSMLSHMIRPNRILEIGTYTGYSAIAMAQGLPNGGKLTTIDVNPELEKMISHFIQKAGLSDTIEQITGNALEIIPTLTDTFDLVFIDADKRNYTRYLDLVINKVRTGGYILTDNVLWSGKVTMPKDKIDVDTQQIDAFNDYVQNHKQLESILLPVRDGLYISRKL